MTMTVSLPQLAAHLEQFARRAHALITCVDELEALRTSRELTLAWLREVHPFETATLLNLAHEIYASGTALLGADAGAGSLDGLAPAAPVADHEREFLARLCRTIDAHIAQRGFTIGNLAKLLGRSPRQLQRDVVRLTGLIPRDILRIRRMVRARSMLRSRQFRTVAEVANQVGMTSSHFSRAYTSWAGYPPTEEPPGTPEPTFPVRTK